MIDRDPAASLVAAECRAKARQYGLDEGPAPLSDTEREAMFAWVRERMERCKAKYDARLGTENRSAATIGDVTIRLSQAFFPADRQTLADDIATLLGEPFTLSYSADGSRLAWSLCESAGWPS
jgi:hypothetical protein